MPQLQRITAVRHPGGVFFPFSGTMTVHRLLRRAPLCTLFHARVDATDPTHRIANAWNEDRRFVSSTSLTVRSTKRSTSTTIVLLYTRLPVRFCYAWHTTDAVAPHIHLLGSVRFSAVVMYHSALDTVRPAGVHNRKLRFRQRMICLSCYVTIRKS